MQDCWSPICNSTTETCLCQVAFSSCADFLMQKTPGIDLTKRNEEGSGLHAAAHLIRTVQAMASTVRDGQHLAQTTLQPQQLEVSSNKKRPRIFEFGAKEHFMHVLNHVYVHCNSFFCLLDENVLKESATQLQIFSIIECLHVVTLSKIPSACVAGKMRSGPCPTPMQV